MASVRGSAGEKGRTPTLASVVMTAALAMVFIEVPVVVVGQVNCTGECWVSGSALIGALLVGPAVVAFRMRRRRLTFLECVGAMLFTTPLASIVAFGAGWVAAGGLDVGSSLLYLLVIASMFLMGLLPVAGLVTWSFHRVISRTATTDRSYRRRRGEAGAVRGRR